MIKRKVDQEALIPLMFERQSLNIIQRYKCEYIYVCVCITKGVSVFQNWQVSVCLSNMRGQCGMKNLF